MDYFSKSR